MKKLSICFALVLLARFCTGCMFLPPKVYDGSEQYYQAHPEQATPPSYLGTDPQPLTGS
jgi:hypothetical protein